MRGTWIGAAVVGIGLGASPRAHAIIGRHDVDDARYLVDEAELPALVDLFEPGDCLGTLVHPSYLLTVAHCAVDLEEGGSLDVGGQPHEIAAVRVHPSWRDEDAFDIALVRLSEPVTEVEPVPLYRGDDELGAVVTLYGRGLTGTGLEGEPGGHDDAQLRHATNVVSSVGSHFLELTFEEPGDEGITALEGVGAAGDSGGPVFVEVEGERYLVGLNSWGDGGDCYEVSEYGASDFQTRVSQYLDWLDDEVGSWPASLAPPTAEPKRADVIPRRRDQYACGCSVGGDGSALALLVPLLVLCGRRRTRR